MKQIKLLLCGVILFTAATNTNAQLGGLLKKAKDKVTPPSQTQATTPSSTPTQTNKPAIMENTKETANEKTETTFYLYDQQYGYSSGGSNYTVAQFINQKRTFRPNDHIRKSDEKGTFHFAKDYPELAPVMEPINNAISISFHTPYNVEVGKTITSFTSKSYIYARITANTGTIKEALKIGEKDAKNPFYNFEYVVVVYHNKEDKYNNEQIWNSCLLKDADLDKNYLDFDVLPSPDKATTIISALSDFSAGKSTAPLYAAIQPNIFAEDGMYKIDVIIRNPTKDGWGNLLAKDKWPTFEADFDFEFNANDVAMLKKNKDLASSQAVEAAANAPRPLPKQWKEKSSALAMGYTQAQLMALYESSFSGKFAPYTVIKFHASASNGGWTVQNNEYGIPRYRYSNQWYTVFVQFKDGKKACFFQGFGLRQDYQGGGTYGKVFCDKNDSYHYADCAEMK
ncbi:MAG: hypothetical protein ACQUYJ_08235 [Ferruginibacter sp.]